MATMRLFFKVIFLFLVCSDSLNGQTARDTIVSILMEQESAWNQGDIPGFMIHYQDSEDLVFLSKSGPNYGWQATLDRYNRTYPDQQSMGVLKFEIEKVTRRSDSVYSVIGQYHLDRIDMDNLTGYFLLLFQRIRENWMIVADATF